MNLEDVARRAKVSTATVSRVLNNASLVKPSTRARVIKAVEELRYHPNLHARSLAAGESRTLGIIISNMENPFFFDIYKTIESDAHAHGYEALVANTDYSSEQLVSSIRLMIGRRVAGLAAIVSEVDDSLVRELQESRIPVVFYDVGAPGRNINSIRVNYRRGIEKILNHLHGMGHHRLGFVGHHGALGPLNERMKTVMDAMAANPSLEVRTADGSDSLEGGQQAARTLLDSGFEPTAIISVNDIMAVGVLRELRERGIRTPEDISVTGFDNIKLSEFCSPALTTVNIPRDQIGHMVFECLAPESGHPCSDRPEIVIEPELIVRQSTAAASAGEAARGRR
jgi:DNA-binding LacI/PurR family transcriptional regulator